MPHAGEYVYFDYFVPPGATQIAFTVDAASGDHDIYLAFGNFTQPTRDHFTYRSAEGEGESLVVTTSDSQACTGCQAHLAVYAWKSSTAFTVTVASTVMLEQQDASAPPVTERAVVTLLEGESHQLTLPQGTTAGFRYALADSRALQAVLSASTAGSLR